MTFPSNRLGRRASSNPAGNGESCARPSHKPLVRAILASMAIILAVPVLGVRLSQAHEFPQDANGHAHIAAQVPFIGGCGTYLSGAEGAGSQLSPLNYSYNTPEAIGTHGNTADHRWLHDVGGAGTSSTSPMVFDMGTPTNKVVLIPSIDHPPIPEEALEATVYGANSAAGPWTIFGDITTIYDQGFSNWISDDYASVWLFPQPYRYFAVGHGGPGAQISDGDAEIDALCATTASLEPSCDSTGRVCKDVKYEDADGDGLIERGEEVSFIVTIAVHNPSATAWDNVTVKDNFGGEIDVTATFPSQGTVTLELSGATEKVHMLWTVGTIAAGATATLVILAETDTNPGEHQEYTSCGVHDFNSGATLKYRVSGKQQSAGTGSVQLRVWCPGRLFAATDNEEFQGRPLPDNLAVATLSGWMVNGVAVESTDIYVNGLEWNGAAGLYVGDPLSNDQSVIDFDGDLVSTVNGPLDDASCCNEDIAFDGVTLWRADWIEGPLFQFTPAGALVNTYNQTDVVGATFVGSTLWLTKWSAMQVGTFDPATNTFTPVFTTSNLAGGLAYDPGNNVLWVGLGGGSVQAWDLTASPPALIPGSTFQPFGPISNTIDGLAFVPD